MCVLSAGVDQNAPLLINSCGGDPRDWMYTSLSNTIFIHFETDGPATRSEFSLSFEAVDDTYEGKGHLILNKHCNLFRSMVKIDMT